MKQHCGPQSLALCFSASDILRRVPLNKLPSTLTGEDVRQRKEHSCKVHVLLLFLRIQQLHSSFCEFRTLRHTQHSTGERKNAATSCTLWSTQHISSAVGTTPTPRRFYDKHYAKELALHSHGKLQRAVRKLRCQLSLPKVVPARNCLLHCQ